MATTSAINPAGAEAPASDPPAAASGTGAPFDWKLGLILGSCAFDAYVELPTLKQDASHLVLKTPAGTELTFVDDDLLQRHKYAGLLEVTVKSASGLRKSEFFFETDPFCVITVDDSTGTTRVIKDSRSPQWDEKLWVFVSDPATQKLKVRVMDRDLDGLVAPDRLGDVEVPLTDLVEGSKPDLELPLNYGAGTAGTVSLGLRYVPFEDHLPPQGADIPTLCPVPDGLTLKSPWLALQSTLLKLAGIDRASLRPTCYINDPKSDTQAWLFWNSATREACLAFRGTEPLKAGLQDVRTDINLRRVAIDPDTLAEIPFWKRPGDAGKAKAQQAAMEAAAQGSSGSGAVSAANQVQGGSVGAPAPVRPAMLRLLDRLTSWIPFWKGANDNDGGVIMVHDGFRDAYDAVRTAVLRLLDTLVAGDEQWTLYLTGHSLGAALSTLCTYDCARRSWSTAPKPAILHYNYGSPRVGNRPFADEFARLVPTTWRVVNDDDAVTRVPRLLGGYRHVGNKAKLEKDGTVVLSSYGANGRAYDDDETIARLFESSILEHMDWEYRKELEAAIRKLLGQAASEASQPAGAR